MNILDEVAELMALGYDVIPVGVVRDGTFLPKDPGLVKGWQTKRWTGSELRKALKDPRRGIGLRLSLNTVIDIESDTKEADDYATKLFAGVRTVSWRGAGEDGHYPGLHRLFRLSPDQQAWMAAFNLNSKTPWPGGIEVRTSGQSVLPPSGGRKYEVGYAHQITTLPDAAFNELVSGLTVEEDRTSRPVADVEADSPGSDFCQRGDWGAILTPHGWRVWLNGMVTRPGKEGDKPSGTCRYCQSPTRGDLLYIFSTSEMIRPLEPRMSYSKFEAYAILNFGGDFSEAARDLKRKGFGVQEVDPLSLFEDFSDTPPVESPGIGGWLYGSEEQDCEKEEIVEVCEKTEGVEPVLNTEWFDNPIGEYCLALRPFTWVDTAAVYLQALEIFGALVGRNAWYKYGMSRRMLSDYLIVVGETGSGKGLAFDHAKTLFIGDESKDHENAEIFSPVTDAFRCINMGRFGSGEGLATALMQRKDADSKVGEIPVGEQYRGCVLATDQEGVGSFKKMVAESSTLGDALLKCWDTNSLSNTTKAGTLYVRNPLVSLIWHITPDILEDLPATLLDGGLINRLKFVYCLKPERLSREKAMPTDELLAYKMPVEDSLLWVGGEPRELVFDKPATDLIWDIQKYQHNLTGIVATTHERFTAHVERLACRLALLRRSPSVGYQDVETARAIHRYCFEWTERLIGPMRYMARPSMDAGQTMFETGLEKWGVKGTTLTTIRREVFNNRISSKDLWDAVRVLEKRGSVTVTKVRTGGRSATVVKFNEKNS